MTTQPRAGTVGGIAGEQLRVIVDRIERLELEKKAIADDIKSIYEESKSNGFDTKTIRKIIKIRKMTAEERAEEEALLDIYLAALGMLADTPLGQSAIDKLTKKDRSPPVERDDEPEDEPAPEPPEPEMTRDDARRDGALAARDGKPVTANPWGPLDPRRAAWEEGWCSESGSDGMDLPDAWKRTKPPKAEKPANDGEGKAA